MLLNFKIRFLKCPQIRQKMLRVHLDVLHAHIVVLQNNNTFCVTIPYTFLHGTQTNIGFLNILLWHFRIIFLSNCIPYFIKQCNGTLIFLWLFLHLKIMGKLHMLQRKNRAKYFFVSCIFISCILFALLKLPTRTYFGFLSTTFLDKAHL
jgi:hypothetical protein